MALEEAADDAWQRSITNLCRETFRGLRQREVRFLRNPAQDQRRVGVDPVRAYVATALVRFEMPTLKFARHSAHGRRHTNTETRSGLAARSTGLNSIHDAAAKIDGKSFGHQSWPPSRALTKNHIQRPMGIT